MTESLSALSCELLRQSGIDTIAAVSRYHAPDPGDQFKRFLAAFGSLRLDDDFLVSGEIAECGIGESWLAYYGARTGSDLIPVGRAFSLHMTLLMNQRGRTFAGFDELLRYVAGSGIETLNTICSQYQSRRILFEQVSKLMADGVPSRREITRFVKNRIRPEKSDRLQESTTATYPKSAVIAEVYAIGQDSVITDEYIATLKPLLDDEDDEVRRNVCGAIGNLANTAHAMEKGEILSALLPGLIEVFANDRNPEVQDFAGFALGNIGSVANGILPDLQNLRLQSDGKRARMTDVIMELIRS